MVPKKHGFNVIGYVSANSGVSVSTRHLIRLLLDKGYPVAVYDVDPGLGKHDHDRTFAAYAVKSIDELPYKINLVILFIHQITPFLLQNPSLIHDDDRLNVGLVYWELGILPPRWIQTLETFDCVIATSNFVRSTMESHLSGIPIIYADCPLYIPSNVQANRQRFGLPRDPILFVYSFDPYSDRERKNPLAVGEAFRRAFPGDNSVRLVVKLNSSSNPAAEKAPVSQETLVHCFGDDPRIQVMSQPLTYTDILSLYASCDVYVSLHRAEGLGLGLMEAMALGKPVIATGWSGNMSFMNYTNSCPVQYRLVPADGFYSIYKKQFLKQIAMWAEPNIEDAVKWMLRVAGDAQLRRDLGAKAVQDMRRLQRHAERAGFIAELEALWYYKKSSPDWVQAKVRNLETLRRHVEDDEVSLYDSAMRKTRRYLDRYILWRITSLYSYGRNGN